MKPTFAKLVHMVASIRGVEPEALRSECREKHLVRARAVVVQIATDDLGYSSNVIGRLLGRHHTTVLFARDMARRLYGTCPDFTADVDEVRKRLRLVRARQAVSA